MHRTGVSSAGSTEDLIPDFISVKNPKDLGRNEPLLAFQRDYHSLQMKLNNYPLTFFESVPMSLGDIFADMYGDSIRSQRANLLPYLSFACVLKGGHFNTISLKN